MKTLTAIALLVSLPLIAQATIHSGTIIVTDPAGLQQERTLNAGDLADQWVIAFEELRGTSKTNNIEILTLKDGQALTIDNIFKLERSPNFTINRETQRGNLIIATQRIGSRDFRTVIDPRQIRYIRETQP